MFGIISRYITKNLLVFFSGILFVFMFVVFMGQFSRIFTYAMTYGADMLWVMSVMSYMVPDILVLSIPMAFQISILMSLTSMSQTGEIMALRAAGFSFGEITRPILVLAVILSLVMIYLTGWLAPQGRHKVKEAQEDIATKISKVNIEPKTFINIGDWDMFAESVDKNKNILNQVHLSRKNDKDALSTKVNAAQGKVATNKHGIALTLFKGQMQRVQSLESRKIITAEFDSYDIFVPLSKRSAIDRIPRVAEMTTPKIFKLIANGTLQERQKYEAAPEPAFRVAMSLAALVFFFLSCPVAFVSGKKAGRAAAMIFSILIIFSYFALLTIGHSIGEKVNIAAISYTASLLPVAAGLIISYYLWKKRLNG